MADIATGANFFRPWVGQNYGEGYRGLRTLVVGACHVCSLPCTHKGLCMKPETVREMDHTCPCYKDLTDQQYYCLSNSNEIEIQSFIDCEASYPSYKIFTYYMLKAAGDLSSEQRLALWSRLAFTNLLQHFHDQSEQLPDDVGEYAAALPALEHVITELTPQVIVAWDGRVKECLKMQPKRFHLLGRADMPFGLELNVFLTQPTDVLGQKRANLRYHYGITSENHRIGWYRDLLRKHLLKCIHNENDADKAVIIDEIAIMLMNLVDEDVLGSSDKGLYFPKSGEYVWTSLLKGMFLKELKNKYPSLRRGTNQAIEAIFGEKIATNKSDNSLLKNKSCKIVTHLNPYFPGWGGKDFSKLQG